eukprot:scaffold320_cov367-Pinguiococcus_pyrenoidosus.AAC.14
MVLHTHQAPVAQSQQLAERSGRHADLAHVHNGLEAEEQPHAQQRQQAGHSGRATAPTQAVPGSLQPHLAAEAPKRTSRPRLRWKVPGAQEPYDEERTDRAASPKSRYQKDGIKALKVMK